MQFKHAHTVLHKFVACLGTDIGTSSKAAKEEQHREQGIIEARKAAGAFPTPAAGMALSLDGYNRRRRGGTAIPH